MRDWRKHYINNKALHTREELSVMGSQVDQGKCTEKEAMFRDLEEWVGFPLVVCEREVGHISGGGREAGHRCRE